MGWVARCWIFKKQSQQAWGHWMWKISMPHCMLFPLWNKNCSWANFPKVWYVCAQSLSHGQLFCDPMDYSLPGSSVHGILQERILEWVAISSSKGLSRPRDRTRVSCISCTSRRIFYHLDTWEALLRYAFLFNSIHFQSGLHFLEVPITEPLFLSVTKEGVTLSSTELEQVGETTVGLNKSTEVQQELWLPTCTRSAPLYPAHKSKYIRTIINNIEQFNRNQPKQCKPSGYS